MDTATRTGVWIIAAGVIIAFLSLARDILAPLALAVFLFLIIEGFARMVDQRLPVIGRAGCRFIAILLVIGGFVGFIALMAQGISQFSGAQSADYEHRINQLISDAYARFGVSEAPTLTSLMFNETGQRFFGLIANAITDLSSDLVLILIYVAFLFLAQSNWPVKLDRIFSDEEQRQQVSLVGATARQGIERYLWTQTVISAINTLLTYISLRVLGVENAMFLSALIFVLNYIPTVGSIVAAMVPPLFALVQPVVPAWMPGEGAGQPYLYAGLVLAVVSFWQFMIGNFLQPRMMGDSLNLSALVVLVSLAIWGAIWGIPGMFLSAPLTVLMMVLFSQSPATRWIAILLSADGDPHLAGPQEMPDNVMTNS